MAQRGKRSIFQDGCTLPANEGVATASILPGHLVEPSSDDEVGLSAADGTKVAPLIADYDFLRAGTVDDAHAVGERVVYRQLESGKLANVRVAASQNITNLKTPLASNGDGTFRIAAAGDLGGTPPTADDVALVYADEVINTGASVALVRVRGA